MTIPPTARPRDPEAPLRRIRIGAVDVIPLVQLHYRPDPARFFPELAERPVGDDAWYAQAPYLDDGRLAIDMGGFLVRTPDRTVLIDAGVGNGKSRPNPVFERRDDPWLDLLARTRTAPGDIDTVVFTHLHVDHVGFATTWDGAAWVPTFPAATYRTTAAELEYWTSATASAEAARLGDYIGDSVLPLADAGVLELTEPDAVLSEHLRLLPAPGHTPGNVCVEVRSEGRRAVFAGDMIHHALQLAEPRRSTDFCIDRALADDARAALLASLGPDDLLFPAHFPGSLPGRVEPDGAGGYRFHVEDGEPL